MKTVIKFLSMVALLVAAIGAEAQTVGGPFKIFLLRQTLNVAYLTTTAPPGTFCPSNVYEIDTTQPGGKAMFALAQSAMVMGRTVNLEIAACGTGLGGSNYLQSVYGWPQ